MGHSCLPEQASDCTHEDYLLAVRLAAEDEMWHEDVTELENAKKSRTKYEKNLRRLDHAARWQQVRAKRGVSRIPPACHHDGALKFPPSPTFYLLPPTSHLTLPPHGTPPSHSAL